MAAAGLQVRDLVVHRGGREVLRGVSLSLDPGEVTCLLGANGAGKSTLVMTIVGSLPATAGSATLDGTSLLGLTPDAIWRRGLAVVLEGHPVLGDLTVLDNLRAAGSGLDRVELDRSIGEALVLFPELTPRLAVGARHLSGGQKQMVAIARVLVGRPRYMLVDELSFGLAPAVVGRLGATMTAIAARGVGILLIEQFTSLALKLASRTYVMERGRIVFTGTSGELRDRPDVLHGAYLATATAERSGAAGDRSNHEIR
jgi:branched-chain amino acid transport system ATP-binding protein